jgi:hypothetical protein
MWLPVRVTDLQQLTASSVLQAFARMTLLATVVFPLTNPSKVRCGRYVIHGFARHDNSEALVTISADC